ncbi:MAG: peptidoglycan-binding protein [Candidatus Pacebacteria bacterium]|nr:peptidoglycan-binding protein [Candidatus Paceibacterota bacterium]
MKKLLSYLFVFSMVVLVAGTFTSQISATPVSDVKVCHKTDSEESPWDAITIIGDAENTHVGHDDDFAGPTDVQVDFNDQWCVDNAPQTPPQEVTTATISATKIVCPTEDLLPNWGNYGANITPTTADEFLAAELAEDEEQDCHKEGWNFAWSADGVGNPGDNTTGTGGAGWTGFDGSTTVPAGAKIWLREQVNDDYIPFSTATSDLDGVASKNSAEFYCHADVLNYDNWEWIDPVVAGETYHCVAFNVLEDTGTPTEEDSCLAPVTVEDGDKLTVINNSGEPIEVQAVLDSNYGGLNKITSETGIQTWNIPVGTTSVTVDAKLLGASAGNTNKFGYYFDNNTSTFVSLFTVPGNTNPAIDPAAVVIDTTGHTSIGFAIKSGDTVWATKYGLNGDSKDHVAVYEPVTGTYALAFEDLSGLGDKDYNDLIAELTVVSCTSGPNQCDATSGTVVSDTTATVGDGNAVALTFIHPGWTANIPGATWIWATNPVESPTNDGDNTKVFTKTFTVTGTPTSGTLDIAVDNNYTIKLNGNVIPVLFDQNNFQLGTQDTYNVSSFLVTGLNTLEITAVNWESAEQSANPAENPAGVLFKLAWESDCGDLPPPPVDVCTNIDGNQASLPQGNYFASAGICLPIVPPPTDVCVNIEGNQSTMPEGYHSIGDGYCAQDEVVIVDVCANLPGNQSSLPDGYTQNGENCYSQNQCSDGIDNTDDEDGLVDANDPGCHTDGNPENIETYVPTDNDETNGGSSEEVTDVCTNIDGFQDQMPQGKHYDDNGDCVDTTRSNGRSSGSSRRSSPGQVLGAETTVCNWDINTYMRKGYKNDAEQVKILQKDLLNGYMKLNIPVDGVYGQKTEDGVRAFQLKHKDKILTPWNLTLPTGIFYKTTLVEAKNTICPEQILPIPTDLINWSKNLIQVPKRA